MQNEVNVRSALRTLNYLSVDLTPSDELALAARAARDVLAWILEEPNNFGEFVKVSEPIVDQIEEKLKEQVEAHASASR